MPPPRMRKTRTRNNLYSTRMEHSPAHSWNNDANLVYCRDYGTDAARRCALSRRRGAVVNASVPGRDRTIALIGLMGAGKTTIGRRLAARLGLPFVDSDKEVEAAAGCTVAEIFERFGEAEFRKGERRVIARLLRGVPCVMATGGGAFIDEATRKEIKANALSIWLRADIDVLMPRVERSASRPLLRGGNARETMERLIAERYPLYALADIVVDSDQADHELMVGRILDKLGIVSGP